MGNMIACDKVCLGMALTSKLLSCDKSRSSLVAETSREGIYDSWIPFGQSIFRQLREI